MKPKTVYLWLCIAGTALPLLQLSLFLRDHWLDPGLFVQQLFREGPVDEM